MSLRADFSALVQYESELFLWNLEILPTTAARMGMMHTSRAANMRQSATISIPNFIPDPFKMEENREW